MYAITPQNEPLYAPATYPGMSWAAGNEDNFIKNNLSPALPSAGLSPKIITYDYSWYNTAYAYTLLGDATTRDDIAAISCHRYSASPTSLSTSHCSYAASQ